MPTKVIIIITNCGIKGVDVFTNCGTKTTKNPIDVGLENVRIILSLKA